MKSFFFLKFSKWKKEQNTTSGNITRPLFHSMQVKFGTLYSRPCYSYYVKVFLHLFLNYAYWSLFYSVAYSNFIKQTLNDIVFRFLNLTSFYCLIGLCFFLLLLFWLLSLFSSNDMFRDCGDVDEIVDRSLSLSVLSFEIAVIEFWY